MLDLIYKRVLGRCHPALKIAMPCAREQYAMHSRSLETFSDSVHTSHRLYDSSLWTFVVIYNHLPEDIVSMQCIKEFQSKLTHIAKWRANMGDPHWRVSFQSPGDMMNFFHA